MTKRSQTISRRNVLTAGAAAAALAPLPALAAGGPDSELLALMQRYAAIRKEWRRADAISCEARNAAQAEIDQLDLTIWDADYPVAVARVEAKHGYDEKAMAAGTLLGEMFDLQDEIMATPIKGLAGVGVKLVAVLDALDDEVRIDLLADLLVEIDGRAGPLLDQEMRDRLMARRWEAV